MDAVKAGILPVPLSAPPLVVPAGVLDQLNVVPDTGPASVTRVVCDPLHTTWLDGAGDTVAVGFTVIVKLDVVGVAEQPFGEVAVTIYVDVTGTF